MDEKKLDSAHVLLRLATAPVKITKPLAIKPLATSGSAPPPPPPLPSPSNSLPPPPPRDVAYWKAAYHELSGRLHTAASIRERQLVALVMEHEIRYRMLKQEHEALLAAYRVLEQQHRQPQHPQLFWEAVALPPPLPALPPAVGPVAAAAAVGAIADAPPGMSTAQPTLKQ